MGKFGQLDQKKLNWFWTIWSGETEISWGSGEPGHPNCSVLGGLQTIRQIGAAQGIFSQNKKIFFSQMLSQTLHFSFSPTTAGCCCFILQELTWLQK